MAYGLPSSTSQPLVANDTLLDQPYFYQTTATRATTPIRYHKDDDDDEPKAAGRSVTTKLLLLIALLWKSDKITDEQKGILKEILILGSPPLANDNVERGGSDGDRCHGGSWVAKLAACLEFFEASKNDVDELAHTFARICRLYTIQKHPERSVYFWTKTDN